MITLWITVLKLGEGDQLNALRLDCLADGRVSQDSQL